MVSKNPDWKLLNCSELSITLIKKMLEKDITQRYSIWDSLDHPWITKRPGFIPLRHEELMSAFFELKNIKSVFFASCIIVKLREWMNGKTFYTDNRLLPKSDNLALSSKVLKFGEALCPTEEPTIDKEYIDIPDNISIKENLLENFGDDNSGEELEQNTDRPGNNYEVNPMDTPRMEVRNLADTTDILVNKTDDDFKHNNNNNDSIINDDNDSKGSTEKILCAKKIDLEEQAINLSQKEIEVRQNLEESINKISTK